MRARLALALCLCWACREPARERPGAERRAEPAKTNAASPTRSAPERHDLLSSLGACEIEHKGELVDLGTPGVQARRAFAFGPLADGSLIDRGGATFERVTSARLALDVWLDEPVERPSVSLRVHGGAARLVHVSIDGKRLGALRLPSGETKAIATNAGAERLEPGRHRIELRFTGVPRGAKTTYAELDWLRIGEKDPDLASYAAPTFEDVLSDVVLDRVPKQSLVLRAPSSVRCWLRPAKDARLKLGVGLWGSGRGVAEVRVLADGEPPQVLVTKKVSGGDNAVWVPLNLDLGVHASKLIGVEFRALEATRGGRIAFGDPVVARRDEAPVDTPRARVAVLVVLSATDRRSLPPWGPTRKLTTLGGLVREGIAFAAHRAPTTVAAGSLATLLTGLGPSSHGLDDSGERLAPELRTLGEIVKEANGRSGFFSGVPTSFAPFGFNQGFDTYETISPVKDLPASEPLARAERWLEQQLEQSQAAPILLVIHARGSHPPWDLSREETQALKPGDYSGGLDPRRGGIYLGQLRARRLRAGKRLLDDDWTRLAGLTETALAKQDAALGRITALLRERKVWDETLFVVTSDVAPGGAPDLPFDPRGPLSEDRLLVPLLMKLPGGALAGREVQDPSSAEDVTVTVLHSLGLNVPARVAGLDLTARAHGREPLVARAQIATLQGRYVTRIGSRLLRGAPGTVPALCALDVDPACADDAFGRELIAGRALWQATFARELAARSGAVDTERVPAELDEETASALVVWGDRQ
jgi:hypothetical protein